MQLFRQGIKAYWISFLLISSSWILLITALLNFYGLAFPLASVESFFLWTQTITGAWILGNIFNYYTPQKGQIWIGIALPLIFAAGFTALYYWLIMWVSPKQVDYILFLQGSSILKGTYLYIFFQFWTILLLIASKLEDQQKIKETETHTAKLAKEAEMYHLRQQLQPHFLFNSLNSIAASVKLQPDQAREMIVELADFLRGTIRKDGNQWIPMEEELVQIQKFLYIEKVRFGSRLDVQVLINDGARNIKIPQLMIQPLLENAIKHGLYGVTGEVMISLKIGLKNDNLQITIQNPFDPQAGQAKGSGFGLEAVNRRLQLLFGRTDLLKINKTKDSFHVELTIPHHALENHYH
ncbi:sensor histidine kinase [Mongoliitalea daihaiensis]|uniref:sensor histidine kinase n=1 Tax=Mongoliitalea daihaiensis TaxID=2782006 RepID=UPI001F31063A|nr:histidine kinase [Mongoliitalea daihaiensis]UJP65311.1 histidine kinase [Mongoliitalea daihaiensis]